MTPKAFAKLPLEYNKRDAPTMRQQAVYAFIIETISDRGRPPTVREIGRATGIRSTNGVCDLLRGLVSHGWIAVDRGRAGGIRVPMLLWTPTLREAP